MLLIKVQSGPTENESRALYKSFNEFRKDNYTQVGKEVIVSQRVKLGWCEKNAKEGERYFELLRLYGYRNPHSAGLAKIGLERNPSIDVNSPLSENQKVKIPFYYVPKTAHPLEALEKCNAVLIAHGIQPFLIRGHEAYIDSSRNRFYPGIDIISYRQLKNQPEKPAPLRSLASTQEPEKENFVEFKPGSEIFISTGWYFDSLSGGGADGSNIVSNLQPFVQAQWRQNWKESFFTQMGVLYEWKSYMESDDPTKQLNGREFTQSQLDVGFGLRLLPSNEVLFGVGMSQVNYFIQSSEDVYSIEQDQAMKLDFAISQNVLSADPLHLGLFVGGAYWGSGAKDFQGGFAYRGGVLMEHRFDSSFLRGMGSYESGQFSLPAFDYSMEALKLKIIYGFDL